MGYYSKNSSGSSSKGYVKSYNNSTKQTCSQRGSPTKNNGTWYDSGGGKIRNTSAYFKTVDKNGKRWESCSSTRNYHTSTFNTDNVKYFDDEGFDNEGFDIDGYNELGYDNEGYNKIGLDYLGKSRE